MPSLDKHFRFIPAITLSVPQAAILDVSESRSVLIWFAGSGFIFVWVGAFQFILLCLPTWEESCGNVECLERFSPSFHRQIFYLESLRTKIENYWNYFFKYLGAMCFVCSCGKPDCGSEHVGFCNFMFPINLLLFCLRSFSHQMENTRMFSYTTKHSRKRQMGFVFI